jgi:hypothetical protein
MITVDTDMDMVDAADGSTSLREAIAATNAMPGPDEIVFDFGQDGPATILLTNGELQITDSLTINGPGANLLTIDASGNDPNPMVHDGKGSRIFNIDDGNSLIDTPFTIVAATLTGGDATVEGGAIFSRETVTIATSVISGNSVWGGITRGVGISAAGDVIVNASTISRNAWFTLSGHGGGIYAGGNVTVDSSTISGNGLLEGAFDRGVGYGVSAGGAGAGFGGGIHAKGSVTVSFSTVTGNSASSGGGIWSYSGPVVIKHSIVAGNTGFDTTPDLRPGMGPLSVEASLIGNNQGDHRGTPLTEAPVGMPDAKGNLIGGPILGIIDPMLAPLADNGGPTLTHALLSGSSAINAGDLSAAAGVGGVPEFDQRGKPFGRVVNGRIDIGAVEYQQPSDLNLLVDALVDEADDNHARGDLSLREAIALTNAYPSVDTIRFDPALAGGTILLTKGELKITDILTIDGPGAELLTIDASGSDPTPSIDDGKGSRIFYIDAGNELIDDPVTVRGLTLTGGDAYFSGGAILARETLLVNECTITKNAAGNNGGAISGRSVILSSSNISSNLARSFFDARGGGILAEDDVTVTSSTITGNAVGPGDSGGGGILAGRDVTVSLSTISGNWAPIGGGIRARNVTVTSSVICENGGGGISALGNVSVNSSTILENPAGGGIRAHLGNVIVTSSTISGNGGGGINARGYVNVTSSTIMGNAARGFGDDGDNHGGGIHAQGDISVTSSTITGNLARDSGGGVSAPASAKVMIKNSIVAGNTDNGTAPDLQHLNASMQEPLSIEHSLIGDNKGTSLTEAPVGTPNAKGNLIGGPKHGVIDPKLGPLANYGGPTFAHALLPGSPAINAGDPNAVAGMNGVPLYDQRGAPFVRVAGGRIDMGAVESQPIPPAVFGDYNVDGIVDARDYVLWRAGLGDTVSPLSGADGSGNGFVDEADYQVWRINFGRTLPAGSSAIASVAWIEPVREAAGAVEDAAVSSQFSISEFVSTKGNGAINSVRGSAARIDMIRSESRSRGAERAALENVSAARRLQSGSAELLLVLDVEVADNHRIALRTDSLDAAFSDHENAFQITESAALMNVSRELLDGVNLWRLR